MVRKILRSLGMTAAIVGSVGLGTTPAHAGPGAVAFVGEAHINCFGCGVSTGTADLCAIGYIVPKGLIECVDEPAIVAWANAAIANLPAVPPIPPLPLTRNVHATYTVFEAPATCPVTGSATGSTTGDVEVTFNWTRVGATAVITTTSGDIVGGGVAAFAVTDPIGNPCGGPVTAVVAGAVAGL